MVVPLNAPKSSILIGCSIINHPAIIHISGGTPRSCISIGLSIINNPANASLIDPPIRLKFHLFQAPKPIHIIHGPMAALGCTRLMFILDEQMYPFISSSIPCILIHIYLSLSIYLSIHSSIHLGGNKNTISNCPLISVSTFLMEKKNNPTFCGHSRKHWTIQVLPAASFHMGANFRPDAIDRRHFFSNPTQRWRQREITFLFYTNPANPVKHICKKYVYIYIYIHTYSYNHSFYLDYNLSWFILFFYLLLG